MKRLAPVLVLVAFLCLAGMASGVPLAGPSASPAPPEAGATAATTPNGSTASEQPGTALSGAVGAEQSELSGELQSGSYEYQLATADSPAERTAVLAEMEANLSRQAQTIQQRQNRIRNSTMSPAQGHYRQARVTVDAAVTSQLAASGRRVAANLTTPQAENLTAEFRALENRSERLLGDTTSTGFVSGGTDLNTSLSFSEEDLLNETDDVNGTDDLLNETDGVNGTDDLLNETDGVNGTDSFNETREGTGSLNESDGLNSTDGFNETDTLNSTDSLNESDGLNGTDSLNETDSLNSTDSLNDTSLNDTSLNDTSLNDTSLNSTDSLSDTSLNDTSLDSSLSVSGSSFDSKWATAASERLIPSAETDDWLADD